MRPYLHPSSERIWMAFDQVVLQFLIFDPHEIKKRSRRRRWSEEGNSKPVAEVMREWATMFTLLGCHCSSEMCSALNRYVPEMTKQVSYSGKRRGPLHFCYWVFSNNLVPQHYQDFPHNPSKINLRWRLASNDGEKVSAGADASCATAEHD